MAGTPPQASSTSSRRSQGPEFGADLSVNLGNYDLRRVQGAVNVPLKDNLAIRAAFNVVRRDGYLEDGFDDDKQESGRIRVGWEPTDDLKLGFKLDYAHIHGQGQSSVVYPTPPGVDPWMSASGPITRLFQIAANALPVPADGFVENKMRALRRSSMRISGSLSSP